MAKKQKRQAVDSTARSLALQARPCQLTAVKKEEKEGKLYVTVNYKRPAWQRILGADSICARTFGLDPYGRRVYESCDGSATVEKIVERFSRAVHVSLPEAEMAVTKFIRTLISKGLIAVEIERKG